MFSLGLSELFIIFLGILLFIKPEYYPRYYKKLMDTYSKIIQFKRGVEREFNSLNALSEPITEKVDTITNTSDESKDDTSPVQFKPLSSKEP